MKSLKWIFAPAMLAAVLGTASFSHPIMAAPKAGKAGKGRPAPMLTPATLEKIMGKPLTEEQKTAIGEAAKAYQESVAKALGMSTEELAAKAKEFRKTQRKEKAAA